MSVSLKTRIKFHHTIHIGDFKLILHHIDKSPANLWSLQLHLALHSLDFGRAPSIARPTAAVVRPASRLPWLPLLDMRCEDPRTVAVALMVRPVGSWRHGIFVEKLRCLCLKSEKWKTKVAKLHLCFCWICGCYASLSLKPRCMVWSLVEPPTLHR